MENYKVPVSGPVNAVRLEGSIGGIKKVIYLFLEFHMPLGDQTECVKPDAPDISQYLTNQFKQFENAQTEYDFFLEEYVEDVYGSKSVFTQQYIDKLRNMFSYHSKNRTFKKTRFHAIDLRGYIAKATNGVNYFSISDYVNELYNTYLNRNSLSVLIDGLQLLAVTHVMMYDILVSSGKTERHMPLLHKNVQVLEKYTVDDYKDTVKYVLNKISSKYGNKTVKDGLSKVIQKYYKPMSLEHQTGIFNLIKNLMAFPYIDTPYNKLINYEGNIDYYGLKYNEIRRKLLEEVKPVLTQELNSSILLIDLYLLRRILDKNYVKHAVVYTGASHSFNYIYILIKYFGFKITHVAKKPEATFQHIEKKIKQIDNPEDIAEYFYPDTFYQCVDMAEFPKNFS